MAQKHPFGSLMGQGGGGGEISVLPPSTVISDFGKLSIKPRRTAILHGPLRVVPVLWLLQLTWLGSSGMGHLS